VEADAKLAVVYAKLAAAYAKLAALKNELALANTKGELIEQNQATFDFELQMAKWKLTKADAELAGVVSQHKVASARLAAAEIVLAVQKPCHNSVCVTGLAVTIYCSDYKFAKYCTMECQLVHWQASHEGVCAALAPRRIKVSLLPLPPLPPTKAADAAAITVTVKTDNTILSRWIALCVLIVIRITVDLLDHCRELAYCC
jgi:hypothetical protein